jgi:hypothetical protein
LALSIVRGSVEDLDSLEPLWVGVHHVHAASMPDLAPYVSDAETWSEHRPLYVELFEKPDTRLLLARLDAAPVGYALIHVALRGPLSVERPSSPVWTGQDRRSTCGEARTLQILCDLAHDQGDGRLPRTA